VKAITTAITNEENRPTRGSTPDRMEKLLGVVADAVLVPLLGPLFVSSAIEVWSHRWASRARRSTYGSLGSGSRDARACGP
jgi:hypothetical protein